MAPPAPSKSGGPLGFLTQPNPDINYDVIVAAYAVCCGLCAILYAAERFVFSSDRDGTDFIAENRESLKGLYIIFTPFLPCLLWAAAVRRRSGRSSASEGAKEKGE